MFISQKDYDQMRVDIDSLKSQVKTLVKDIEDIRLSLSEPARPMHKYRSPFGIVEVMPSFYPERPTIRGEVDAIIEHLGITFDHVLEKPEKEHFVARKVKK